MLLRLITYCATGQRFTSLITAASGSAASTASQGVTQKAQQGPQTSQGTNSTRAFISKSGSSKFHIEVASFISVAIAAFPKDEHFLPVHYDACFQIGASGRTLLGEEEAKQEDRHRGTSQITIGKTAPLAALHGGSHPINAHPAPSLQSVLPQAFLPHCSSREEFYAALPEAAALFFDRRKSIKVRDSCTSFLQRGCR